MTIQELDDFSNLVQLVAPICLSFEKKPSVKIWNIKYVYKTKIKYNIGVSIR